MLKWIKNSKAAKTNTTSKFKGVRMIKTGRYEASVLIVTYKNGKKNKRENYIIGYYDKEKEAANKRVEFILNLI